MQSNDEALSAVLEKIVALGNAIDKLDARRPQYIHVPDWLYETANAAWQRSQLCLKKKANIDSAVALANFKRNSSFWPMQFKWLREYPCVFE